MNKLWDKRIPTLLGIGLVAFSILLTSVLVGNQTIFKSRASPSENPENIKISNISDSSFTVSYKTKELVTGSINVGKNKNLGTTELEDTDREKGTLIPHKIHSITIKNLLSKTKYYFVIISGQNTFLDKKSPFEVTTGPNISSPSTTQKPLKGKVVFPDGKTPSEAIVYLTADNSQTLSNIVEKDGIFSFNINLLRTQGLSSYFEFDKNTTIKLIATTESLTSNVLTSYNTENSIPTITLSNDYDFSSKNSPEEKNVASKSAKAQGFSSLSQQASTDKNPKILIPKKNQEFVDSKPQFRGISLPNEKVIIKINSEHEIQTQIISDSNGNWTYVPSNDLSPGEHTITIQTKNSQGILQTITQSFTVFAAEVSPTVIPTSQPTVTPALSPTITLIFTPTLIPLPTATPIITLVPTQVVIPSQPPISELAPTGNSFAATLIGALVASIAGITLFLLAHSRKFL